MRHDLAVTDLVRNTARVLNTTSGIECCVCLFVRPAFCYSAVVAVGSCGGSLAVERSHHLASLPPPGHFPRLLRQVAPRPPPLLLAGHIAAGTRHNPGLPGYANIANMRCCRTSDDSPGDQPCRSVSAVWKHIMAGGASVLGCGA